jgi:crotonobetaine/carnitine-CoA ligase
MTALLSQPKARTLGMVLERNAMLAAAFSVPSELADEDIMLSVTLRPGSALTVQELDSWLSQRLPPFAVPRYFLASMPVTETGKIRKYELRTAGATRSAYDARALRGAS